ncbi:DUF5117 domain-containing protein [Parvularcula sp. ZS-1/3]|uniref:DUF5117 domain-containing protein n=1 Tax=Parvularcula mediterranea TaxID=2732508 RepID=A0A7Y3W4U4_9PROT|nr:zinc-dependent metalloprotease [Parvularcula mediterranea]NNU15833.1 DUF5117 domain-containing protein [Parvularcula mediterranea]
MRHWLVLSAAVLALSACGGGEPPTESPASEAVEKPALLAQSGGFVPLELTEDGKLIATLPVPDTDGVSLRAIHAMSLSAGLGSNPLGLDRGLGERGRVIRFRIIGKRVTAEAENTTFRASAENNDERLATEQSFGRSILWSGVAEKVSDEGVRVDLSGLFLTDLFGVGEGLGGFTLAKDRSMIMPGGILGFPDNTEIDTELTFAGSDPGIEVRRTAPFSKAVTLSVHHTLARLPEEGYEPKRNDSRLGAFEQVVYDFSAPLAEEVPRSFAMRHRIEEGEPIVFYVDRGAPEPIKSALIEGAMWWAEGFEAAGLPDAYRVEELPEGIHPADIRYNVIRWVHRQTRGWSYGGAVADPRTGEMLKGNVILGSQRVRQDRMIFEGLAGVSGTGSGDADDPIELSLARIRQLSAHEVGHALGFDHNFAASTADRASVMDYPAPYVRARNGQLDFSETYATGLGEWDKLTVRWLYGGEDASELMEEAREAGVPFIQDSHGRGVGSAHPEAAVWDNGADPVTELANVIAVRALGLEGFDTSRVADGQGTERLRQALVPIYLYHRYQVVAAAKSLGGARYTYGQVGDVVPQVEIVSPERQRTALDLILRTLDPNFLDLPDELLTILPPGAGAMVGVSSREAFGSRTGEIFDLMSAAEASADISLGAILAPRRLERLHQFAARDDANPSLEEVLEDTLDAILSASPQTAQGEALAALVEARLVAALMDVDSGNASTPVRAEVQRALARVQDELDDRTDSHSAFLARQIEAHLSAPAQPASPKPADPQVPPGSPIGGN